MNKSATKSEKGELSKTPMTEPVTPTIPSPLNSLDVPKQWFENHTAYGRTSAGRKGPAGYAADTDRF